MVVATKFRGSKTEQQARAFCAKHDILFYWMEANVSSELMRHFDEKAKSNQKQPDARQPAKKQVCPRALSTESIV